MADKSLKTRIMLKYDTIEKWNTSELVLKKGEVAIAEIPQETTDSGLTPPALGLKVGDGTKTFKELQWIQAIAGDVYGWAKEKTKPTYAATEITGLEEFISGEVGDTNTQYQIVTEDEGKTYKLQKKDVGEEAYTDVVGSTVDLQSIYTQLQTLTQQIEEIDVTEQITAEIEKLKYEDSSIEHQFVTQVVETNGVISVTRAQPTTADIDGLDAALAGKQDTLQFATPYDPADNKVATKSDIDSALAGLSGALKYKGSVEELPGTTADYSKGDVISVGNKEYVCEGESWRELGDESSYAVKGSIKNDDIADNAAISASKISGLAAIATTGEVKDLQQTDGTILVFDCGDSTNVE